MALTMIPACMPNFVPIEWEHASRDMGHNPCMGYIPALHAAPLSFDMGYFMGLAANNFEISTQTTQHRLNLGGLNINQRIGDLRFKVRFVGVDLLSEFLQKTGKESFGLKPYSRKRSGGIFSYIP